MYTHTHTSTIEYYSTTKKNEIMLLPGGTSDKELPASAGDVTDAGSIPGSGRSPAGG